MKHVNWDNVQESQMGNYGPQPGGYIAQITSVTDNEQKEYLKIEWDFIEGEYAGSNAETYRDRGFWPYALFRSYKDSALGFFKAFKTAVEESNPRYYFDDQNVNGLVGKYIGIVLAEEEYEKKDGSVGKRLYVYQARSVDSIQHMDFVVPEVKPLNKSKSNSARSRFVDVECEEELPF